jgi:hypothetical protein
MLLDASAAQPAATNIHHLCKILKLHADVVPCFACSWASEQRAVGQRGKLSRGSCSLGACTFITLRVCVRGDMRYVCAMRGQTPQVEIVVQTCCNIARMTPTPRPATLAQNQTYCCQCTTCMTSTATMLMMLETTAWPASPWEPGAAGPLLLAEPLAPSASCLSTSAVAC